jgi:hypothetical protein
LVERLPENGVGRTISGYLEAFNSGDTAVMRRFFAERSVSGPDSPPLNVRLERYQAMRANLGRLTLRGFRQSPEGDGLAVSVTTESGDPATLTFSVQADVPFRLRSVRVEVGQ